MHACIAVGQSLSTCLYPFLFVEIYLPCTRCRGTIQVVYFLLEYQIVCLNRLCWHPRSLMTKTEKLKSATIMTKNTHILPHSINYTPPIILLNGVLPCQCLYLDHLLTPSSLLLVLSFAQPHPFPICCY